MNRNKLAQLFFPALTLSILTISSGNALSAGPVPSPIAQDLAMRSSEIHWPTGFLPQDAVLFAHNEITIEASCDKVWRHLIAATKWPEWYPNSADVRIANDSTGKLNKNSRFNWSTFGLPVESVVHEFMPDRRLGWFGKAPGVDAYHTWLLVDNGRHCTVVTEEVTNGTAAADWRKNDPGALRQAHELWLVKLKQLSEK